MSLSTNQVIGFAPEATPETDPITSADTNPNDKYWKFGAYTFPFELGTEQHEYRPEYFLNSRDPNQLVLQKTYVDPTIMFLPVNGIWWYYFCGDSATVTGVHTVSAISTGSLPTLTHRWEDLGGTAPEYNSNVGCKAQTIVWSGNFGNQSAIPMSMAVSLAGIKSAVPSLNSAHDGTKYPTDDGLMAGTEVTDLYKYDSNMVFTWDGDSFLTQLTQFQYTGVNLFMKGGIGGQTEREYIHEGYRTHNLLFRILRGTSTSIFDDFLAETKHDCVLKIYNTATNYMQVTFNDCAIEKLVPPYTPEVNDSPYYQVECSVTSITPVIKDGIDDGYYGD